MTDPVAQAEAPAATTIGTPEAPAKSADEAFDKALESFDPFPDEPEDLEPEERAEAEEKKAAPKKKAAEEPDGDEEGEDADEDEEYGEDLEDSAEEDEDDEEEPESAEDELDHAYSVLLGLPAHVRPSMSALKSMSRPQLIAWAARVEEHAATHAERSSVAENGRDATGIAKGADDTPSPEITLPPWDKYRAGAAEGLGVSEESMEWAKPLHGALERCLAELSALRSQREQDVQESRARDGQAKIDAQLQRLGKDYPALLSDKKIREKLLSKAGVLAKTGDYTDAASVFDDAVALVPGLKKARANGAALSHKRRNGVSTPPSNRSGFGSPMASDDDDFLARMDLVESGQLRRAMNLPPPMRTKSSKRKR